MPMLNPPHPGEGLKEDVLAPLGLTVTETAKALGISRKTLSEISSTASHRSRQTSPCAWSGHLQIRLPTCGCACRRPTICARRSRN